MGLLTSPTAGGGSKKLASLVIRWEPRLSPLLYLGGLVWFLALAYYPYNAATYFSENALLPGLVTNEFADGGEVHKTLESLKAEVQDRDTVPHAWLRARFQQMGLEAYGHNFTLHYPLGHGQVFRGENTYAILRAPRAGGTESLVLAAPFRQPGGPHASNQAGVALMLSLAAYFRRQVYWAKDLVFLVTEHEQLGAAAWLSAYHQAALGEHVLDAGDLPARAGSIQAAINLEVESPSIGHVDVVMEGLNGQLPNLDLVKMAHWILHQEHIMHTTQNRRDHNRPSSEAGYLHSLRTLLAMVVNQAAGTPTGNHGHFHQYGIQAVTLRAVEGAAGEGPHSALAHLGRALEGMFRSLNNLLERFHQSFFFYLLPATSRYVSIGLYMPPFALIAIGIVLRALTCWLRFSLLADPSAADEGSAASADAGQTTAASGEGAGTAGVQPREEVDSSGDGKPDEKGISLSVLLVPLLASHAAGVLTLAALAPLTRLLADSDLSTEESVFAALAAASVLTLIVPLLMSRRLTMREQLLARCLALAELGLLLFTGALLNISAALIVTVMYAPVALSARRYSSRLGRLFASISLLLVHPFTLQLVAVTLGVLSQHEGTSSSQLLRAALTADQRAVTFALVDSLLYGARLLDVTCTVLLPVWLQLWGLVHCSER